MELTINGAQVEVRKINIGDYEACKNKIRSERINAVPNMAGQEVLAKVIAAPITNAEIGEFIDSRVGLMFLFKRCSNNRVKDAEIEELVMTDSPQLLLWLQESYPNLSGQQSSE